MLDKRYQLEESDRIDNSASEQRIVWDELIPPTVPSELAEYELAHFILDFGKAVDHPQVPFPSILAMLGIALPLSVETQVG